MVYGTELMFISYITRKNGDIINQIKTIELQRGNCSSQTVPLLLWI
eukprot:UN09723